ncbi:MAG TPA: helix-turn-helix domain-containing protein [Salinivirgaceae bacterium]|nr:helix-turn-helix domain-containing protein [Salinivirgaceae bacterium]
MKEKMPINQSVEIGKKLKKYFDELGYTQQNVADKLGVSQAAVSALLNGKPFGKKLAAKWAEVFGLRPNWLLTGEGEMFREAKKEVPTVKQRLTEFLEKKNISKTDFGKTIGVSSAFVTSIRKSIQPDKIKSIALNYPYLNIGWLLTGVGEMFKESESGVPQSNTKKSTIERLIEVREETGLLSKDFAKKAGIDPKNYSSIENGKRSLGDRVINDICNAFNINALWLKTGNGDKYKTVESEVPRSDMISLPREAFDQITQLTQTVLSQQRIFHYICALFVNYNDKYPNLIRIMRIKPEVFSDIYEMKTNMAKNQTLAEAIKAIKFHFDLNQDEIAEKTGITVTYLSDLIGGRSPLSETYSDKLNAVFGVSKSYLKTGKGEIFDKRSSHGDSVTMSREVFDQISRLTETVLSQQRTIERIVELQKGGAEGATGAAPKAAQG